MILKMYTLLLIKDLGRKRPKIRSKRGKRNKCQGSVHGKTKRGHKMVTEKGDLMYHYTKKYELQIYYVSKNRLRSHYRIGANFI